MVSLGEDGWFNQMMMSGISRCWYEAMYQLAMVSSARWYGHVLRREDGHVMRRGLDIEVEG